jgi:hypothetical protein
MAENVSLIIQLPAGSALDRQLAENPPPSAVSAQTVIEPISAGADGRIEPPEAGQVLLSFLSPEDLRREADQVRQELGGADGSQPPVVVIEVAEELREDELSVLLQAAERAGRTVVLCVLLGTS